MSLDVVTVDEPVERYIAQPVLSQPRRFIDPSWDFKGENAKSLTHGFHTYPAVFVPAIARRLLERHSNPGDTVCDIFCGSGTTLVESMALGRHAIGIDLNPLATLLARVKTTPLEQSHLNKTYGQVVRLAKAVSNPPMPEFNNVDFWFKPSIKYDLAALKYAIRQIDDDAIQNFFLIALSETIRICSNSKNGEFKLVRFRPDKLAGYNPDPFAVFATQASKNIVGMSVFWATIDRRLKAKVMLGDSTQPNGIEDDSIDLVMTSPPYGDSRTTVAYGQFSRLSAQWLDLYSAPNDAPKLDKHLLGGTPVTDGEMSHLPTLERTLSVVSERDQIRAQEVEAFFAGLYKCFANAYRMLKPNKYFAIVIGNRLVKNVRIPTDTIVVEQAAALGFDCEEIITRTISNKRMPSKNSPTNIVGLKSDTMTTENIVMFKKN